MALTQSDLDALDAAIAAGAVKVRLEGREVDYGSIADLKAARAHVADQLAAANVPRQRASYHYHFTTLRGF